MKDLAASLLKKFANGEERHPEGGTWLIFNPARRIQEGAVPKDLELPCRSLLLPLHNPVL